MVRPLEEFRVKINGNSLQVWSKGEYAGSVSLKELCQMVVSKRRDGTRPESVQDKYLNGGVESGGCGTTSVVRES